MTEAELPASQRIDKWLWCARFFKTRSLAGKAVAAGDMRLTRGEQTQRIIKASFSVQQDDTIAFTRHTRLFIVRVKSCALRRGPAPEAQALYEDLSPPPPPKPEKNLAAVSNFEREKGAGRPTKKDRRDLEKVRQEL
ncbi:MAG: RNA-binding S4 domain-containing protein [Aquisalinus sp.]|nr:RNA-binding S4 domain-containing protein [Aquisalinus sp.]